MQVDCVVGQDGLRKPVVILLLLDGSSVGQIARSKKPHSQEPLWTPVELMICSFQYKRNEKITIDRKQFPMVPAGITIHRKLSGIGM